VPEGHTIHGLALRFRKYIGKSFLATSPKGQSALLAKRIDRQPLLKVEALGKHLLLGFEAGTLHIHLGLFGSLKRRTLATPLRASARLVLSDLKGAGRWELVGATTCELLESAQLRALADRIGPDLLDPNFDEARAVQNLGKGSKAIGLALMDQSRIGGVGNVYRAEALFLAGIHPDTPCSAVPLESLIELVGLLRDLLRRGVREGKIRTVGEAGSEAGGYRYGERVWIYRRKVCRRCDGLVRAYSLGARTAYVCETCQRPERLKAPI
jgi:endonuclease VIII